MPPPPTGTPVTTMAPPTTIPDGLRFEPDPTRRLDGWIRADAHQQETGRLIGGGLMLALGGLSLAGAVATLALTDDPDARWLGGSSFAMLGITLGGVGLTFLEMPTPREDRLGRWERASRDGIDSGEIASFSAEIRAEADEARYGRLIGAYVSLATAAGGLVMIFMTSISDLGAEGRITGYAGGSALAAPLGIVGLIMLLSRTPLEREWDQYEQGLMPAHPTLLGDLRVVPAVGPHLAGLSLGARF